MFCPPVWCFTWEKLFLAKLLVTIVSLSVCVIKTLLAIEMLQQFCETVNEDVFTMFNTYIFLHLLNACISCISVWPNDLNFTAYVAVKPYFLVGVSLDASSWSWEP